MTILATYIREGTLPPGVYPLLAHSRFPAGGAVNGGPWPGMLSHGGPSIYSANHGSTIGSQDSHARFESRLFGTEKTSIFSLFFCDSIRDSALSLSRACAAPGQSRRGQRHARERSKRRLWRV